MPTACEPAAVRSPEGGARRFGRRDWLIAFLLFLATIQCVRADFFVNDTFLNWRQFALGQAPLPFQGRVGMMPILRWAGDNMAMRKAAAGYAATIEVGTVIFEPNTVEKFTSMLIGLVSLSAMMLATFWWSRRRGFVPWWLANVLVLLIMTVTTAMRSTTNYWYPYDLPHAALFGVGILLALEGMWPAMLVCYAVDVPVRETAIFLILVLLPVFALQRRYETARWLKLGALTTGMALYWAAVRFAIHRRFRGNLDLTYSRIGQNIHEILFPHHWPQLLSAGGYLVIVVWLERRRLPSDLRMLLYGCAACVPITLWFGVWTETRVWMEWTLPLAAMAAAEALSWMRERRPRAGTEAEALT